MKQSKLFGEQIAKDLAELTAHLKTHESICEQRYTMICARLKRLEHVLMTSAGAIILLLIGIVIKGF
jgi:hypothetical protein|tara:strand:+ start:316 stop:516 length:201 start_codon:yes stop_codon:yes gene_type:complete